MGERSGSNRDSNPTGLCWSSVHLVQCEPIFANVSHQIRLDTRSKARRPIKVELKGEGGRERAETRTLWLIGSFFFDKGVVTNSSTFEINKNWYRFVLWCYPLFKPVYILYIIYVYHGISTHSASIYIYIYIYFFEILNARVLALVHTCRHTHTHAHTHTRVRAYTHTHTRVRAYTHYLLVLYDLICLSLSELLSTSFLLNWLS